MLLLISFTGKSLKNVPWRCVSFVCALFFQCRTSCIWKKQKKNQTNKGKTVSSGNPVNKENFLLFSRHNRHHSRCHYFLFVFNVLFFPHRGKPSGIERWFEHRHSVYIYQNFFAFNRAIAIKCVHVTVVVSALFFWNTSRTSHPISTRLLTSLKTNNLV